MSETPPPANRPSRPQLGPRPAPAGRPVRPQRQPTTADTIQEPPPAPPPAIAETTVIALPPEPPSPRRPSPFGSVAVRQSLIPPCGVLATGLLALGVAFFCQSADAALRQWPPAVAVAAIALGLATAVVTALLSASVRRVDSAAADS